MIRTRLKELIDASFARGVREKRWSEAGAEKYTVEIPKHENQGDYSTNIALVLAGIEKRNPREIAAQISSFLEQEKALISSVSIAGPGFVNITIQPAVWQQIIGEIEKSGESFGRSACRRWPQGDG